MRKDGKFLGFFIGHALLRSEGARYHTKHRGRLLCLERQAETGCLHFWNNPTRECIERVGILPLGVSLNRMNKKLLFPVFLIFLGLIFPQAHAPSTTDSSSLFKTIQSLDTQLFDAYNHCELATLSSLVADDLEFYHDVTGFSPGRQSLVDGVKKNICGKVTRELVPGSLEVYPIAKYGAVEIGIHRFRHPGSTDAGEAKFITLWQNKDGVWKVTRAISFDHHPLTK